MQGDHGNERTKREEPQEGPIFEEKAEEGKAEKTKTKTHNRET